MDPLSRRDLRLTLKQLAQQGVTIIVSSHILSELADMCSSLCVMNQGSILATGTVDAVRAQLGQASRSLTLVVLEDSVAAAERFLHSASGVSQLICQGERLIFNFTGNAVAQSQLLQAAIQAGLSVRALEEQKSSFEEILITVAEGNRHAAE
jgi:ABC-2 type transport system ATP-binding protein